MHASSSSLSLEVAKTGTQLTNELRHATTDDDDWVRAPTDEKDLVDDTGAPSLQDAAPQPDIKDRFFRRSSLKKLAAALSAKSVILSPKAARDEHVSSSSYDMHVLGPKAARDELALLPDPPPDAAATTTLETADLFLAFEDYARPSSNDGVLLMCC